MRLKAEEGLSVQVQSAELKMAEAKKRIEGQQRTLNRRRKRSISPRHGTGAASARSSSSWIPRWQ